MYTASLYEDKFSHTVYCSTKIILHRDYVFLYPSVVLIDFLNTEFTVNEGQGPVTVTLVKSGLTTIDYGVELTLVPRSAGELHM